LDTPGVNYSIVSITSSHTQAPLNELKKNKNKQPVFLE